MNGYSKPSLFLYSLAILPLFLFGCDSSSSSSGIRASTEDYIGTWKLTKVNNTLITDQALLVILDSDVSREEALTSKGECSGATLAEVDGEELFLVEARAGNCFVEFPKEASAQLALHDIVYAGVKASLNGNSLVLKDLRNNAYYLSRP